jgi:hypothetical protein
MKKTKDKVDTGILFVFFVETLNRYHYHATKTLRLLVVTFIFKWFLLCSIKQTKSKIPQNARFEHFDNLGV